MTSLLNEIKELKSKMVCRKVDNEIVLVPIVSEVAEMKVIYTLNEVASFIWEKVDEVDTFEEIVNAVFDNFDTDKQTAINDINDFFNELLKKKI